MQLQSKDTNDNDVINQSEQDAPVTVDSVMEKYLTAGKAILSIIVMLVAIGFVGQLLLWKFAPDTWDKLFGVDESTIADHQAALSTETTPANAETDVVTAVDNAVAEIETEGSETE